MKKLVFFLFFSALNVFAKYNIDEFTLKNGLQIIFIGKKSVPIISLSIWYKSGANCDTYFKSGVAHFFEHMAFEINEREFGNYLEDVGAISNAFTSLNTICFYEIFPKDYLEKVLFYESQRMQHLNIEDKVFQNEKKAILEERSMRTDSNPHGAYSEALLSNLFNRQIGGIGVVGWKHEIESIQKNDLQEFHKKWIVPNNAILILVGDFDFIQAKNFIKKYFENIPSRNLNFRKFSESPKNITKQMKYHSKKLGSLASVEYIFKIPFSAKSNLRKLLALSLALEIIQQPSFFIKGILKQMKNLISALSFSYIDGYYLYDILSLNLTGTSVDNLEEAKENWEYFRTKLCKNCITEEELKKIKKKKLISLAYQKEDVEKISNHFGWYLTMGISLKDILSMDEIIQSITVKECNDVLREIFSSEPIFSAEIMPKGYDRD